MKLHKQTTLAFLSLLIFWVQSPEEKVFRTNLIINSNLEHKRVFVTGTCKTRGIGNSTM